MVRHLHIDIDDSSMMLMKPERNSEEQVRAAMRLVCSISKNVADARMLLDALGIWGKDGVMEKCMECGTLKLKDEDCQSPHCVFVREEFEREMKERLEGEDGSDKR